MPTASDLRALLLFRHRALAAYEEWERRQPRRLLPPDVFAQLDAIRRLLPPEVRAPRVNEDDYAGIRRMHQCLAVLEVPR